MLLVLLKDFLRIFDFLNLLSFFLLSLIIKNISSQKVGGGRRGVGGQAPLDPPGSCGPI